MSRLVLAMLMMLAAMPTTAKSIVVLGDSISAGYGLINAKSWVQLLQQRVYQEHWDHVIYNQSISGDTTVGGLARLQQALSYKPDVLILELGVNDCLRGVPALLIKTNLTEIIQRVQKTGAKLLLLGMRPTLTDHNRFNDFYDIYPQLAHELGLTYISFITKDNALTQEMLLADGLHPNDLGQPFIANKIWPHLSSLLK